MTWQKDFVKLTWPYNYEPMRYEHSRQVVAFVEKLLTQLADEMEGCVGKEDNLKTEQSVGYNTAKSEVREAMAKKRKEWEL